MAVNIDPFQLVEQINRSGYAIVPDVIGAPEREQLVQACEALAAQTTVATRRRRGEAFARRNLLDVPAFLGLSHSRPIRDLVGHVLGSRAHVVRGILFDKTPGANWTVPWHQDLSIAVKRRRDVPGFGPWSDKAGIAHVQPPAEVLRQMVTVRLHLDDCFDDNGPLRVVPGTHAQMLSSGALERHVEQGPVVRCVVEACGALLMRPMLVHSSSPAIRPRHRRVVHLEFAACELPGGLEWHTHAGVAA